MSASCPLLWLKPDKSQLKLLQRVKDGKPPSYGKDCNIIQLLRYQRACPEKWLPLSPELQEEVVALEAQSGLCSSAPALTL